MTARAATPIIRKVEIVEGGGHHGGGWKVAYADFMTAMMAFFLLLWILSSSDEQKLRGIAEYFTNATMPGGSGVLDGATLGPPGTLSASNGMIVARGSELGKIDASPSAQWEIKDKTPTVDPQQKIIGTYEGNHDNPASGAVSEQSQAQDETQHLHTGSSDDPAEDLRAEDAARFEALQAELMQAMQENPVLAELHDNVVFEKTPEGLRIQIVDQENRPMFASGKAKMHDVTRDLIMSVGQSVKNIENKVVIAGHTDAVPFSNGGDYGNWDLSSDRANATRRLFELAGVETDRIVRVSGLADTDPLIADDPRHPSNRRVSILLEYRKAPGQAPASQKPSPKPTEQIVEARLNQKAHAERLVSTRLDAGVIENLREALR